MYRKQVSNKNSQQHLSTPISKDIISTRSNASLSSVVQRAQQDASSVSVDEWQQLESTIGTRAKKEISQGKQTPWIPQFNGISAQMWGNSQQVVPKVQRQELEEDEGELVQTKLTVGKPGDKYEQEADVTAAKVMRMSHEALQRNLTPNSSELTEKEEEEIQRKGKGNNTQASSSLESRLGSSKGRGSALSSNVRGFMEARFGADFSRVRVHIDSNAVQMNQELSAQAFTHGNDIYYGAGKSPGNNELTAHELTHTIQQTGGTHIVQLKAVLPSQIKEQNLDREINQPSSSPDSVQNPQQQQAGNVLTATKQEKKPISINYEEKPQKNQETTSQQVNQEQKPTLPQTTSQETTPASPDLDPDFQAVVTKAKEVANKEKKHEPANKKAQQAQDAAKSPASEVESKAQANQVVEMEQAPTPAFNAAAFKAKLMERIKDAAPKNLDQADNFEDNNKLGSVKSQMQEKVKQEQTASQTPLEQKAKQAPDTSSIKPKSVIPLPPNQAGKATKNIGAQKAVPKPKGQNQIEAPLQQSSQQLDQQMAEANVTEEQLTKSNEPQFQAALQAKTEAQTNAKLAPQEYRQFEQNQLNQAKGEAAASAGKQLQGMHGDRAQLLAQVTKGQVKAKGKDEQKRINVARHINGIYQNTKTSVDDILNGIQDGVMSRFNAGTERAKKAYENYVAPYMEDYKNRYDGIWGAGRWVKDKLLGVPSEVTAFFDKGREKYLNEMDTTLTDIANYVTEQLNIAKEKIAEGRKEIKKYVQGLPASLQQVGQDAANNIQGQFNRLEQSVDDKHNQLIDTLSQAYTKNLEEMDARIEEMKASNQPWFAKAFDSLAGVIETINQLKNMLMNVLAKVADTVGNIIKDPIGFLGNLISGIKQGFENFALNIGQHLQAGLIGWLTGTLGPIGIQLPNDIFSLPGIFSLVTQVLGLTYDYFRGKAVKRFGEPVVAGMEESVEIFQVLRSRGAMGLWEQVKEQFNDLKETVIGEIKNMVITQVITAGVKWVLSLLNPASAFVKAAMAIYDIIMFFVNRGSQVLELVNAVVDAVAVIASGAVDGAAKLVENALAKAVPVVIGFLASVAGIGGLAKKVEEIIGRVRSRVDKAIHKVLLKAKKLFKRDKVTDKQDNKKQDKLQRLQKAMKSAKASLRKYSGKKVGKFVLNAKLQVLKLRYRLKSLTPIKQGQNWAIRGEINPVIVETTNLQILDNPHEASALFHQRAVEVEQEFFGLRLSNLEQKFVNKGAVLLPSNLETKMSAAIRKRGEPPVERFQLEGVSSAEWIQAALRVANREGKQAAKANLFQNWGDVKLTDWLNPSYIQPANRFVRNIGEYARKGAKNKPGTLIIIDQLRQNGISDAAISQIIQEASRSGKSITPKTLQNFGHKGRSKNIKAHAHRLTRLTHLTMHLEPARFLDRGLSGLSKQPAALITAINHQMVQNNVIGLDSVLGRGEFEEKLSSKQLRSLLENASWGYNPVALKGIAKNDIAFNSILVRVHQLWSHWKRQSHQRLVRQIQEQKGVVETHFVPTKLEMRRILSQFFGEIRS